MNLPKRNALKFSTTVIIWLLTGGSWILAMLIFKEPRLIYFAPAIAILAIALSLLPTSKIVQIFERK